MRHKKNSQPRPSSIYLETIILSLLISGIYLLITDVPLQVILQNLIGSIGRNYYALKQAIVSSIQAMVYGMEFSNLMGILLMIISLILMLSRIRDRVISRSPSSHYCPSCSHRLHRIHRSRSQRIMSKLLHLSSGYYRCDSCGQSSIHFSKRPLHLSKG